MKKNIIAAIKSYTGMNANRSEFSGNIKKVINEALKTKKDWIAEQDIYNIFFEAIVHQKVEIANSLNEDISDLDLTDEKYNLSDERAMIATDSILSTIESIPKAYSVKFPIPRLDIENDFALTNEISIISGKKVDSESFKTRSPAHIEIKIIGYITNNRDQQSMKEVNSKLKQFIQIAVAKGVFKKNLNLRPHPFFYGSQSILKAIIYQEIGGRNVINQVPLTLGMSEYLSSLEMESVFLGSDNLINKMVSAVKLINCPSSTENSNALKSALEWSFDAAADDDETMRFIKTCIGLEAILGEASENGGITERLADRCAYLLRKTVSQRKDTRTDIRNIYQLRSKLVHGVVTKLSQSDVKLADLGNEYLDSVIKFELRSVEEWWERSQSN